MTDYMELLVEKELLHSFKDWVDGFLQADWWYSYKDNEAIRPTKEHKAFYRAFKKDLAADKESAYDEIFYTEALGCHSLGRWEFEHHF